MFQSFRPLVAHITVAFVVGQSLFTGVYLCAQTRDTSSQEYEFHERATTALAHGRFDEAEMLASMRPETDPSAVALRAHMLMLRGRLIEAESLLLPIAQDEPSSAAGLEFGLLLIGTGRVEESQQYLNTVISMGLSSRHSLDQYRGGLAAGALGRYRDANALLREAVLTSPEDAAMQTAWADLFLEKYNRPDAVKSYTEALSLDGEWGPAHLGMARALVDENPTAARASADRALEIDENNVDARLFIAEQELGDQKIETARGLLDRVLEINPFNLEARALLAAIAYLRDNLDDFAEEVGHALAVNPFYGDIYRIAGKHVARAYRFDEAVRLVQRALELDPSNSRAQAELGMHLLRAGDEPSAREVLERAFEDDPFNVITFNLLSMMDKLEDFQTFEDGDVILRMHPDEAPVLREYVLSLAQEALATLSASYNMEVEGPILIEVFPRHDDFAVRNLGLPGMLGAVGACFGRVVTMDSPRARPPGDFNWRTTLWHEVAHVITLQMSNQRVPRWLTEGISVYEERRANSAWGRDQELTFARALNDGSVLALRDLNAGFSRPDTISLAYFQASLLVEHIVELYGETTLHELVRSYGDGLNTNDALARVGMDFESLQSSIDESIESRFGDLRRALQPVQHTQIVSNQSDRLDILRHLADEHPGSFSIQFSLGKELRAIGDLNAAVSALERASALAPMATGMESPRGLLAEIAEDRGDLERAIRELELLISHDHTSLEVPQRLATLAEQVGDQQRLALAYDRLIGIDPFNPVPHQVMGRLALNAGDTEIAIREFKIVMAVGPIDRVSAYCDLAESYLMAGELDKAKQSTLAALEIAPTYTRAQELLLRVIDRVETQG